MVVLAKSQRYLEDVSKSYALVIKFFTQEKHNLKTMFVLVEILFKKRVEEKLSQFFRPV